MPRKRMNRSTRWKKSTDTSHRFSDDLVGEYTSTLNVLTLCSTLTMKQES